MATFKQTFEPKLIYVYRINDETHKDILKVGEASCSNAGLNYFVLQPNSKELNEAAKERIRHQTQTAGVSFELLYTEITAFQNGKELKVFQDHEVHECLKRSGIKNKYFNTEHKANEWFYTDLETVKKAIKAVKEGRTSLNANEISKEQNPIVFRPEQQDAIDRTIKQFSKKNSSNKMLWNAKMRFGKTLTALQVIKLMNFNRTLILTHRPVVDEGWFDDYKKIFYDRDDFFYSSKKNGALISQVVVSTDSKTDSTNLNNEKTFSEMLSENQKNGLTDYHFIYFASIQDLRGSKIVGGNFDKNEDVFGIDWDFIIIDEAHEGTQTELGQKVLSACKKENTKVLHLSGTPFNLMDDFGNEEIYEWNYVDEQRAKAEWDKTHQGDPNPYACLPRLNIFTYNLGELFNEYKDSDIAFNFKEFFRVDENGDFIHEANIKQFLDLLTKEDENSNYPYSKKEFRENFRHSLWMIPGVKEAKALSKLLQEHSVFSQFNIANVAGDGDEDDESKINEALKKVENAIGKNPESSYSITLSCGRLTTGVSVKPWTACFMLSGSYSTQASTYMQTIFRVQTPAIIGGKQKEECFVFDFAPDRTLKVIAETAKISRKAGGTKEGDRKQLGDFINFCPIIGFEGSKMVNYDTPKMLEQLKKVYVERVVRNGFEDSYLYNNDLMKLNEVELKEFENLKAIIGTTKAMGKTGDIDVNKTGLDQELFDEIENIKKKAKAEKRELTEDELKKIELEKEAKKNRDSAVSILRGISIRMPLMIYGAELNKDLYNEEETITLDNFADKIDEQSWKEFMPNGVTKEIFAKFKKYYDEDVFCAAGKRIRELAKAADNFSIEERIGRISMIFNNFRNPDKETVLTPWRVVNMHLNDCLGGYRFYDEDYKETKEEPIFVEKDDVTKNVFKKNTHILEINSKSGLYALYCAYSIFRIRKHFEIGPKASREMENELWKKVLAENIFVICKTPMAKSITKRTLAGFTDAKVNAHYFEDLVNQLKNKSQHFIDTVTKLSYWKKETGKMKFDAVVGNPPYQETLVGSSDTPIYNYFYDAAFELSNVVSLITPARFLFKAGKTPKDWNEKMLNDEHFKVVKYFQISDDVFPRTDIKGGVCITLRDANKNFGKIGLFSNYPELNSILDKVLTHKDFKTLKDLVYAPESYRLSKKLHEMHPNVKDLLSSGHLFDVTTNIFDKLSDFFFDEKPNDEKEYIKIYGRFNNERVFKYICKDFVDTHENLYKWKVFVPKSNGSGAIGEVLSTPIVGEPIVGHTQTFISIGKFETEFEANSLLKYIKSKFARTLLGTLKATQDNKKETWANVPLQDFTENSDIDWTKSVKDIDGQLYAKYGLEPNETDFINKMIKEM